MSSNDFALFWVEHTRRYSGIEHWRGDFFRALLDVVATREEAEAASRDMGKRPAPFPANNLAGLLEAIAAARPKLPPEPPPGTIKPYAVPFEQPANAADWKGDRRKLLDDLRAKGLWKPKDQRGGIRKMLPKKPKAEEEKVPF